MCATPQETYEFVEKDRVLIALIHDRAGLYQAIEDMKRRIKVSLQKSPKEHLAGVVAVHRETFVYLVNRGYVEDLAQSRILVLESDDGNLHERALKAYEDIMVQYQLASAHTAQV